MLTTDQKGSIAEASIAAAAIKLGIDVYKPLCDGTRCDLIFDLDARLTRVQCKWSRRYGDVVVIRCYSTRRARTGLVKKYYSAGEVDAFAAYCPDTDRCYFVPIHHLVGRGSNFQLRLARTRNNQEAGVKWAGDYEFDATLARYGAVAQLGERDAGSVEAAGSSPAGSTK